jgi:hypothetical protein
MQNTRHLSLASPSFLTLSDDYFMLALCVRKDRLANPARWCAEMRAYAVSAKKGPKTAWEADELLKTAQRLNDEAFNVTNNLDSYEKRF